jgi:hypothetical protein
LACKPQPTPFSFWHFAQHYQVALPETPSNVVTVDGRLLLLHRSIDPSIELCVVSFNVAPHKMSASSLASFRRWKHAFRSTASTAILNSLLTLRSRRPFERVFFFVVVERDLRPDRHLALTWRNVKMTPFTAGFCFALSSMSVTARFLAFLFASHAVDLPAVLQVGVAQCQDFTPQPTPFLSFWHFAQHYQVALPETPSNVVTVDGPLLLLHRSIIDRSIDRTLRRKFQRRSTQNVGELSGFFRRWKHAFPPLHRHSQFTAHPALPTSVRTCIFFVVERDLRRTVTLRWLDGM